MLSQSEKTAEKYLPDTESRDNPRQRGGMWLALKPDIPQRFRNLDDNKPQCCR